LAVIVAGWKIKVMEFDGRVSRHEICKYRNLTGKNVSKEGYAGRSS